MSTARMWEEKVSLIQTTKATTNAKTGRALRILLFLAAVAFATFYWSGLFQTSGGCWMTQSSSKPSAAAAAAVAAVKKDDWNEIRLPAYIVPSAYRINFTTDLTDASFFGTVSIDLNVKEVTPFIVVHSLGFDLTFKSLVNKAGRSFPLLKAEEKLDLQYTIFHLTKDIPVDEYSLDIDYIGKLSNTLSGYYLSTYYIGDTPHNIATTQFEPTDARKAFPCLDEPLFKATFEISMSVQEKYQAISNMPVQETRTVNGWKYFAFQKTVRMSSYLVAFVVSDFEKISTTTSNGILVSVYTPPGKLSFGQYALDVSIPILDFYQKTFGIDISKYPLPKLDMIAIPDFAAGAMENWGLVTYRDTALLFDPLTSTAANKQRVATVVAHELAHQWSGNLVTMKWWSDLWLNEGFAEFMEYKAVDYAEPSWQMLEQFIPNDLVRSLHADESYYTHQIAIPVGNPSEISSIFDDISYGKGSSILRMLQSWMDEKYGDGVFYSKVHNYLTAHAYGNAETADLWEALRTPDQDVGVFMNTWTNQPGFPFLTFDEPSENGFSVRQQRFLFSTLIDIPKNDAEIIEPMKQSWSIPLSYAVYSNSTGKPTRLGRGFAELASLGKTKIAFESKYPGGSILLANFAQTGVYRSLYDIKTYTLLIEWLQADQELLPAVERGGLISDIFSMTFANLIQDPTIAFQASNLLAKETNVLVWNTALKDLESLKNVFALDKLYGSIVEWQTSLIEKVIASIGWVEVNPAASDAHGRALLRGNLLQEAIRNNHEATVAIALGYFAELKAGVKLDQLPADVYPAIYDAGVIYGDLDDYDFVLNNLRASTFAPEQQILQHALCASRTPYLQARTLAYAISGEVRNQDIATLIKDITTLSPVGHISAWIFLMDNWQKIVMIFSSSGFSKFNDLLKDITGSFTKPYLINEAERLFVKQLDPDFIVPPGARTAVLKGLETAKQLLAWRSLHAADVENWLNNKFKENKVA